MSDALSPETWRALVARFDAEILPAGLLDPPPSSWRELGDRAARALASRPGDPGALALLCEAGARRGEVEPALAALRAHHAARAAMTLEALERALHALAAADPAHALECQLLLAREQLRFGRVEDTRRTLESIPATALAGAAPHVRELRASALFRMGDPAAAGVELAQARAEPRSLADTSLTLSLAEYSVARGELTSARRSLAALAGDTRGRPRLEKRRSAALAMSYLFEHRYRRAVRWARRARLEAHRLGASEPLLVMTEVLALLGLDRVDRARALSARAAPRSGGQEEVLGRGVGLLLAAACDWRRGDFAGALARGEPGLAQLDQVARAVVAHYLGRAALGLGQLDRAEAFFRELFALAAEPGLALLASTAALDRALLAEARGDRAGAWRHARRALATGRRSPLAQIERWALGTPSAGAPALAGEPEAARAYLALRAAERALALGTAEEARAPARRAAAWYRAADVRFELCRALRAEGEAALGRPAEAEPALAEAERLAEAQGYRLLQVELALLRASLADRGGDLLAYQRWLGRAATLAPGELHDRALAGALARLPADLVASSDTHTIGERPPNPLDGARSTGPSAAQGAPLPGPPPPTIGPPGPLAALVTRLGLGRPAGVLFTAGDRRWLLAPGEPDPLPAGLVLELPSGELRAGEVGARLNAQPRALLERLLAGADAGASVEELHHFAWGGAEYHPLRHRNAVYVAMNRLRGALVPLVGEACILQAPDGRYRLAPGLVGAMRRPLPVPRAPGKTK